MQSIGRKSDNMLRINECRIEDPVYAFAPANHINDEMQNLIIKFIRTKSPLSWNGLGLSYILSHRQEIGTYNVISKLEKEFTDDITKPIIDKIIDLL